ncbi:hypothetical protein VE04_00295 [Pseudogymnoascus sp. 24MN13]|nr:hypothetical protein VE04_00295 [Pseudogymnoascus sp. 24MN13]
MVPRHVATAFATYKVVSRKFDLTFPVSLSLLYDLYPIPPTFLVSFSSSSAPESLASSAPHTIRVSPFTQTVDSLISAFTTKLSTALALKHPTRLKSTDTTILHRISRMSICQIQTIARLGTGTPSKPSAHSTTCNDTRNTGAPGSGPRAGTNGSDIVGRMAG